MYLQVCTAAWECHRGYTKWFLTFYRGDSKIVQKGSLVGSAWLDNKVVTVLSTTSQPNTSGTVLRHQKDGNRVPLHTITSTWEVWRPVAWLL